MTKISQNNSKFLALLFLSIIFALISVGAFAFNAQRDLTNQQTFALLNEEKLILVDVRTPDEWKQIGLAQGAIPISMLDQSFLIEVNKLRLDNPDKIIAFICASGNRSEVVRAELAKRGFKNIYSVFGGTTGNGVASWIKDGLPVVSYSN